MAESLQDVPDNALISRDAIKSLLNHKSGGNLMIIAAKNVDELQSFSSEMIESCTSLEETMEYSTPVHSSSSMRLTFSFRITHLNLLKISIKLEDHVLLLREEVGSTVWASVWQLSGVPCLIHR